MLIVKLTKIYAGPLTSWNSSKEMSWQLG